MVRQWPAHGQALAEVERPHGLDHRQLVWRQRQIAGAALGLGRHNVVAPVHVDSGLADAQRACIKVDVRPA
jgi:hypothetical protein